MECPSCSEAAPPDATWCEACGHELSAPVKPICIACGELEVGDDGYCLSCGHKQPGERDHLEFDDGPVVAVTDRGKRHRHNEDAVAIATTADGGAVLVVCDGVSTTPGSAEASLRAAVTARDLLVDGLSAPADVSALLRSAVEAAQVEASSAVDPATDGHGSPPSDGGPPSSTLVAVVATPTDVGAELATAWVGDSRAYWVGEKPQRLSSEDHELAGSLVRWLGADSIDPTADIDLASVTGPGHVVVCSDGLWRYASDPRELDELIRRLTTDGERGLDLAAALVDFANEQGGHDNITVALWTNLTVAPRTDSRHAGHDRDGRTQPEIQQ